MPAVRLNPMLRVIWKLHRLVLQVSGGRVGSLKVFLLTTIGHRGGRPRTVGLSHLEADDGFLVASYAGQDRDPACAEYRERTTREIPVFELRLEGP
jgi:hypothetical protein